MLATNILIISNAGETTGYVVSGLLPFTLYSFFLVPFYKRLDGRPSNMKIVQTDEDGKWFYLVDFLPLPPSNEKSRLIFLTTKF